MSRPAPLSVWQLPLRYARNVGEKEAVLLEKNLEIRTVGDLLRCYPFRYEDRSRVWRIRDLNLGMESAQVQGVFTRLQVVGEGRSRRLTGLFADPTGTVEVVWFQRIEYLQKAIQINQPYYLFGRLNHYNGRTGYSHPEMEKVKPGAPLPFLEPVYSTTETLKRIGLDSRGIQKLIRTQLEAFRGEYSECFPPSVLQALDALPLDDALGEVHMPRSHDGLARALRRLKTEELFPMQFFLLRRKRVEKETGAGFVMPGLSVFNRFYNEALPFALTGAQKQVLREIRQDLLSGRHMNRLVQGDVGSGKTVVALMAMLIASGNGYQACLMAPTEILAQQHYESVSALTAPLGLEVALLTGSTPAKERARIAAALESGDLTLLVGTHALIEGTVRFRKLGLSVIDEQHRFGVAQRARLRTKNEDDMPPHVLVMTATPIPRTLAMALYSDLDVSVINELPAGRKEIRTIHRTEGQRLRVFGFLRQEIESGRQVYVVYPMIEESEALDLNNLMEGFVSIQRAFPDFHVSMVHGKMKAADKEFEMARFIRKETQIMVATTVIEVGVNVPNASVMVVENAERFGLTQLHQLRGRVGRGEYQSYCVLMTGTRLSREGKERIEILCSTNDGFRIAEADLKMRGPGDITGTRQSGLADVKLTNLAEDGPLIEKIKQVAQKMVEDDPNLERPEFQKLKAHLADAFRQKAYWTQIS